MTITGIRMMRLYDPRDHGVDGDEAKFFKVTFRLAIAQMLVLLPEPLHDLTTTRQGIP